MEETHWAEPQGSSSAPIKVEDMRTTTVWCVWMRHARTRWRRAATFVRAGPMPRSSRALPARSDVPGAGGVPCGQGVCLIRARIRGPSGATCRPHRSTVRSCRVCLRDSYTQHRAYAAVRQERTASSVRTVNAPPSHLASHHTRSSVRLVPIFQHTVTRSLVVTCARVVNRSRHAWRALAQRVTTVP